MDIIERHVQEIGQSLLVTLPKDWARALNLRKGAIVRMVVSGSGVLSIAPDIAKTSTKREATLVYDRYFTRRFFREYFAGNETIIVLFQTSSPDREQLYTFLRRFMNAQIIEENERKIVIRIFKIDELTMEECLKRMYFLSLNIMDGLLSTEAAASLEEMRDTQTRFYYLLVMLVRRFLTEGTFAQGQFPLVRALDFRMVAEKMQRLSEFLLSIGKIDPATAEALRALRTLYAKIFNHFLTVDYEGAVTAWDAIVLLEKKRVPKIAPAVRYVKDISMLVR
ncbi:hypothetical protein HY639_00585 [Candidatus Woesearchaeota archaeon]|nr:hypothetical protein [Candidatus Woesearchaeota archaeon]